MKFKRTTNPAGSVENQQGLKYKWSYITLDVMACAILRKRNPLRRRRNDAVNHTYHLGSLVPMSG